MRTWYAVTADVKEFLPTNTVWHLHSPLLVVDFANVSERTAFENKAGTSVMRLPSIYSGQRLNTKHLVALGSSALTSNDSTYDAIVSVTNNDNSPLLLGK